MERKQPQQLNAVAGAALQEEVMGQLAFRRIDSLHLPEFADEEAQSDFDHGAVERGTPETSGQDNGADLAQQSTRDRTQGAEEAFGKREEKRIASQADSVGARLFRFLFTLEQQCAHGSD